MAEELDAAGNPKQPMTVLEREAVAVLNTIKAWRDSAPGTPFPANADMHIEAILMTAAMRRKGLQ